MARAIASLFWSKTAVRRAAGICAALTLSACAGNSTFDDLNAMEPVGSEFGIALFKDYTFLAKSFGTQDAPPGRAFDAEASISLKGPDTTISGLANAYALKALSAGRGDDVLPEQAPDGDSDAENVRLELLRDLDQGRDKAPEDAARAQADYDCWILNRRVPEAANAAQICRRSVTHSLAKLERDLNPSAATEYSAPASAPAPSPAPAPAPAPAAAPAAGSDFTVPFDGRSSRLNAAGLAVVTDAINAARAGHQARIAVVGYGEGEKLALRRAEAVKTALVAQGARADAIAVSAGKEDQSADQTKTGHAVITLVP